MHLLRPPKKVIFLHIPKAGGQTFYRIVRKNIPKKGIFQVSGKTNKASVESFQKMDAKGDIEWVMGHMGFGLHRYFDGEAIYVTFLRDPVKRVISYYHFVMRRPDHYLYPAVVTSFGNKMPLEEFVQSCPTTEIRNGQVRLLSASGGHDNSEKELWEEDLQIAMENLEHSFSVIGILEMFDLSLLLMREQNLLRRIHYSRQNTAGKRPETTDEKTISIIQESNRLDQQLYDACRAKLLNQLENDPNLQKKLAAFLKSNQIFNIFNIKGVIDRFQHRMVNR